MTKTTDTPEEAQYGEAYSAMMKMRNALVAKQETRCHMLSALSDLTVATINMQQETARMERKLNDYQRSIDAYHLGQAEWEEAELAFV